MTTRPSTKHEANRYIADHHRHHGQVRGLLFAIALEDTDELCGVMVVGRPVARGLQDGYTAEITRLCTDGIPNGCSMLMGVAKRACRALGYRRLYTYTLASEDGSSVKAAGFKFDGHVKGRSWNCESRGRVDQRSIVDKSRWLVIL